MRNSILLLLFISVACSQKVSEYNITTPPQKESVVKKQGVQDRQVKNIILLIGDGMGLTQITAGLYSNNNRLHLEKFKVVGIHKPYAADNLITDSAAGATAFACGKKTYNGAIGMTPDSLPCKSILEYAEERGMATGLVATSTIVHATPAAFAAHQPQRKMYEAIAEDMAVAGIDFMVGGGKQFFSNRKTDNRDLTEELKAANYQVSDYFQKDFMDVDIDGEKNFAYFTAYADPLPKAQGRDYLLPASRSAMQFLRRRSDNGFFLMIEGSQIDWGGHANSSSYIISEMLEFDQVIGAALQFAQRDGNTLVIVTADHETGGYAINPGSQMDSLVTSFTTDYHTAALIPVFAYGPGSQLFNGMYENTALFDKMMMALGL